MKYFRWLFIGLIAIVALGVLATAGGYVWLRGSIATWDGTRHVAGLLKSVEIVRDQYGVPHIKAETIPDAYFALGYVHAQDRLWQMEIARRVGAGRMSEIFGPRTIDMDRYMRTIGFAGQSERSLAHFKPETRTYIDAYVRGVNAMILGTEGPLAPEFVIFGHAPEPWTAADCVLAVKMMSILLAGNARGELARTMLQSELDDAVIDELWATDAHTLGRPAKAGPAPIAPRRAAEIRTALVSGFAAGIGSNNWVVNGEHTVSGKPMLANDPHLGLTAPAAWYLAHLSAQDLNVAGGTLPGIPAIVSGRNSTAAWGVTNTNADVQDLFVETLDPDDPGRYLTPAGSQPFQTRGETIEVKDHGDIDITVRHTRHGPVVSDVSDRYAPLAEPANVVAMAWTALSAEDTTLDSAFGLANARTIDDLFDALRRFHAPMQNFVLADQAGQIGFLVAGRVPIRRDGDGWLPNRGVDGAGEWRGYLPDTAMPRRVGATKGWIVTANSRVVDDDYPHFISRDWDMTYRTRRIDGLLGARPKHDVASFKAIQTDIVSNMARSVLPLFHATVDPTQNPRLTRLLDGWDGSMDPARPEPAIFHTWYREFTRAVSEDLSASQFPGIWRRAPEFMTRVLRGDSVWCRNTEINPCADRTDPALEAAATWLNTRLGDDPGQWRWGDLHYAHSKHRILSDVPVIGGLFDIKLAHGGGPYTVMQANTHIRDNDAPFAEVHGASLRVIVDLADLDSTEVMISTGQSGNVLSPHYRDLAPLWGAGDYISLPMSAEGVDAVAAYRLTLVPATKAEP